MRSAIRISPGLVQSIVTITSRVHCPGQSYCCLLMVCWGRPGRDWRETQHIAGVDQLCKAGHPSRLHQPIKSFIGHKPAPGENNKYSWSTFLLFWQSFTQIGKIRKGTWCTVADWNELSRNHGQIFTTTHRSILWRWYLTLLGWIINVIYNACKIPVGGLSYIILQFGNKNIQLTTRWKICTKAIICGMFFLIS